MIQLNPNYCFVAFNSHLPQYILPPVLLGKSLLHLCMIGVGR